MAHAQQYLQVKQELAELLERDPQKQKQKTVKVSDLKDKLETAERFIIFNRRTGQVACAEWVQKHIMADPNGRPVMRQAASRAKPWVMTLKFDLTSNGLVDLALRVDDEVDGSFKPVRCYSLQDPLEKLKLKNFVHGYQHLLVDSDGEEEDSSLQLIRLEAMLGALTVLHAELLLINKPYYNTFL